MQIFFATSAQRKVDTAQRALGPLGHTVLMHPMDLIESRSEDTAEIAQEKALQASKDLMNVPVLVEDSGFYIRALCGWPGTQVKHSLKPGIDKVMRMMAGENDRHAEWRMSLAFVDPDGQSVTMTFVETGELTLMARRIVAGRKMASDYWRVYVPTMAIMAGNDQALSEMDDINLSAYREYLAHNNHYAQLGKWFKERQK